MFENIICRHCGNSLEWSRDLTDHHNTEGTAVHYYTAYGFCDRCNDYVAWVEGKVVLEYDLSEIEWE